ncbi:CBS domain-containing protein [Pseudonocardia hispaniensis]|uniref:CBS domain-containing protein n=1 Tax=Pseudonocardia hispaniensis TaxID=904933 RepID=A0ABW1J8B7_9PSEU
MKIADILNTKGRVVHTAVPWTTVSEAVDRLNRLGIGALVSCDQDRKICGIISERDIMRGLGKYGAALLDMKIDEVMTHHVVTTTPDESIVSAMAQMTRGRHRHLPVVQHGALVGMVSIGDLVKHRVKEMELETGVLRDALISRY